MQVEFLWWLRSKESACNARDAGLIPGWERPPEGGNDNPLQHYCLGNLMDREAWWAPGQGVAKSQTRLSSWTTTNHASGTDTTQHTATPCVWNHISLMLRQKIQYPGTS